MIPALKEKRVAGLKPSYVKCRGWGHAWDEGTGHKIRPIQGFHEALTCTRCTSERVFWIGWDGKAVARWYEYPEDFDTVTSLSRAECKLWLQKHDKVGKIVEEVA